MIAEIRDALTVHAFFPLADHDITGMVMDRAHRKVFPDHKGATRRNLYTEFKD